MAVSNAISPEVLTPDFPALQYNELAEVYALRYTSIPRRDRFVEGKVRYSSLLLPCDISDSDNFIDFSDVFILTSCIASRD